VFIHAPEKEAPWQTGDAHDPESQDLMIRRFTLHQKTIWMVKSFLQNSLLVVLPLAPSN
jgi:hypothetical protein